MYKAVIIDDDLSAVENIYRIFDWAKLNVTEVVTLSDANNLTDRILKEEPDIVMIDIELGTTSGLEIIQQCKEAGLQSLFIIISGHYDFDYARTAIKLDVLYFLSKPITAYDVDEATEKIIDRLNIVASKTSDMIDDISVLLSSKEEFNKYFSNNQLKNENQYRFILAETDEKVLEEISRLCLGNSLHSKFKIGRKKYLFVVESKAYTADTEMRLFGVSATRKISIGISDTFAGNENAYTFFKQAYLLSFGKFIYGKNGVYKSETVVSSVSENFTEMWLDKLAKLEQKQYKEVGKFIESVPTFFVANKLDFKHVMFFHNSMAYKINSLIQSEEYISVSSVEDIIAEYDSLQNMCDEFLLMLKELFDTDFVHISYDSGVFEKILEYINTNYREQMSLEKLSTRFNVSISYICKHFKKKYDITFSSYLKNVRLEIAKRLLKNSNMSVMEISEAVGYTDYFYFNKVFKASTGYTPGKYRRITEAR